ncbi:MAG: RidA family protein, partial [Woeseia sp.]|nr:RidA family protein [Woeseia sp.]
MTAAEGPSAAKEALLDILAIVKEDLGDLDTIIGVGKLNGFVRSAPTFTKQPQVIDGASDLL